MPSGSSRELPLLYVAMALLLPLLAVAYVAVQQPRIEGDQFENLRAVVGAKAQLTTDWLREREADARVLAESENLALRVHEFLADPANVELRRLVFTRLDSLRQNYRYESLMLFDPSGAERIAAAGVYAEIDAGLLALVRRTIATREVLRSELTRDADGHVHLDWVAPLMLDAGNRVVAAVVLRVNAADYLYPMLKIWPAAEPSAEMLLVRRDGDAVLYLNELRHRPDAALRLRVPLSDQRLAGIATKLRRDGFGLDRDYRGVEVLGAYAPVRGTDWDLIAKVDRADVLAPMWQSLAWIGLVAITGLLLITLLLRGFLRQQRRLRELLVQEERARVESLQRAFFELPFLGMAITAPDSRRFLQVNQCLCEMLGYGEAEVVGMTWEQVTHAEDLPADRAQYQRLMDGAIDSYAMQKRFVRKDGSCFDARIDVKCIRRGDGGIEYIVKTIENISERLAAERALEASEARFRKLFEDNREGMLLIENGHIIDANRATLEMLGMPTREAILGKTPGDLSPAVQPDGQSSREVSVRNDMKAIAEGSNQFEWMILKVDGTPAVIDVLQTCITLQGRDVLHISWRDITEKKRQEAELARYRDHLEVLVRERTEALDAALAEVRASEQRYGYAIDATHDGLWDWEVPTGRSYCSPAYFRMLGYEPGELPESTEGHLLTLLHPDDRAWMLDTAARLLRDPGHYELEFRMRAKDGSYKWILSRGKVVEWDAAGNPLRAVGTHTDVTERKNMEISLREAKEQAEAANVAKSAFLSNMSHEIRTPMNAIIGFTHLLQRDVTDPVVLERVAKIGGAAKHLLGLIDDILDLSRIEANRLALEESRLSLDATLNHVHSLMSERAQSKRLELRVELEPALRGSFFLGDALRLRQVLVNLVGNAIKFTETGHVEVRVTRRNEDGNGCLLLFEVSDTGIGLDAEQQARLFQPFQQAEASTTRRFGGSGLGLAISQRLVGLMGGEIGVRSEPGAGSTFWFTVRLRRISPADEALSHAEDVRAAQQALPLRAGARVLLVEDNDINQEVARALLEERGLEVVVAGNGLDAVQQLKETRFDSVLMDLQMPVMDGLEATQVIRTLPNGQGVPIIAMTANAFEDDRLRCIAVGMNDFVSKPVEPERLYATLARWIPASSTQESAPAPAKVPAPVADGGALDPRVVQRYFSGKQALYRRALDTFVRTHHDDIVGVEAALGQGDLQTAERLAHTLKGLGATLGMERLHTTARELERRIHEGAAMQALREGVTLVSGALADAEAEIARLEPPVAEPAAAPLVDAGELQPQLAELQSLLECGDFSANRVWRAIESAVRVRFGAARADALAAPLTSYDFDSALEVLRAMRAELPAPVAP